MLHFASGEAKPKIGLVAFQALSFPLFPPTKDVCSRVSKREEASLLGAIIQPTICTLRWHWVALDLLLNFGMTIDYLFPLNFATIFLEVSVRRIHIQAYLAMLGTLYMLFLPTEYTASS